MSKILDWIDKNAMLTMTITGIGSIAAGAGAVPLLMMEKTSGNLLGFTSLFLGGTTIAMAVRDLCYLYRDANPCKVKNPVKSNTSAHERTVDHSKTAPSKAPAPNVVQTNVVEHKRTGLRTLRKSGVESRNRTGVER
ncbi:MAG: hypothetical protein IKQ99_00200 [Alphaproteobacteria bacterium]|nr:hypothetical protein [Alphaproteobacteria bacterium]